MQDARTPTAVHNSNFHRQGEEVQKQRLEAIRKKECELTKKKGKEIKEKEGLRKEI